MKIGLDMDKETGRAEAFREYGNKKDTERKSDFGTRD